MIFLSFYMELKYLNVIIGTLVGFYLIPGVNIIKDPIQSLYLINFSLVVIKLSLNKLNLTPYHQFKFIPIVYYVFISSLFYCFLMILMGAPITIWKHQTILYSLFVSILLMDVGFDFQSISIIQEFESLNLKKKRRFIIQGLLTGLGSWLGSFILPLDWQSPIQVWPIPLVYGSFFGNVISLIWCIFIQ
ncbi:GPI biosynthesis protein Pig-F [Globomyces pollinis-pini]|nr:GPI biosynthesis protein Pig-F [Globomyces pollinis-pini]